MALVKRAEAGVAIPPRVLRRLAWKAGVSETSLFETAPNKAPKLFRRQLDLTPYRTRSGSSPTPPPLPGKGANGKLSTEFLLLQAPAQWPPYRPPPGKLAKKVSPSRKVNPASPPLARGAPSRLTAM